MNKNESVRNYIQFSSCDSLQNRESCRDELYKKSRERWCDELDVCPHPSSGDTFLSICQLLQLDKGNNHQLEHHLWNDSNFYTYFNELEAWLDQHENLTALREAYQTACNCVCTTKQMKKRTYPVSLRFSIETIGLRRSTPPMYLL